MDRYRFLPPQSLKVFEINDENLRPAEGILLVEDDQMFAGLVQTYLESFGYSVTVAEDGVQGMKRVMERDFEVIVCDLMMPNLPGDMFYIGVERVKPELAGRFIFITGHQSDARISEFVKKVRAFTLFKPFELHVLLETIRVILKRSQKRKP